VIYPVATAGLRLVLLRFRFPPLSCLLEGPIKLFKTVPTHLDSALAAAELLMMAAEEGKEAQEFLIEMLLRAYRGQVEADIPSSLRWSTGDANYPLGSALIPVRWLSENDLSLFLPSEKPYILHTALKDGEVLPSQIEPFGEPKDTVEFHNILPLRRRTNIERLLQLLTAKRLDVSKRGLSQITEARGAYRALDSRARLEGALASTVFVAVLDVADEDLLHRCLNMLKVLGIGKKRDMGYGELMSYRVLEVAEGEGIELRPDYVEWAEGELRHRITLRLLPWQVVRSWMAEGWRLIRAATIVSSHRPPYWLRGERRTCLLPLAMLVSVAL